jgi:hypothetical protein
MEDKQGRKDALNALAAFVQQFASQHPRCSKDAVATAVARQFGLRTERCVYIGPDFAVRFSKASGPSFSNTVLSLSVLRKYDHLPFVVCVVRSTGVQLLLANSTFIDKISHSSQRLTRDRIRGSFNGTNILRAFDDLTNEPPNFEALFDRHLRVGFEENYARIVENTLAIKGRGARFTPTPRQETTILAAADLAKTLLADKDYMGFDSKLTKTVERNRDAILAAATSSNVNLRGNAIEQIVTNAGNLHGTEDIAEVLPNGITVNIDIKTKLIGYSSNPAAYNIDKLLRLLASGNAAFAFFFIGIDVPARTVYSRLVSFLDGRIVAATKVQPHWAGRNSRGGTQLAGDLSQVFAPSFRESIDAADGRAFLQRLLAL